MEKKESELEQIKSGNARNMTDTQKQRAHSPYRLCKTSQRLNDDNRIPEVRSCSSGKQRSSRFPSAISDKEMFPRMPTLAEERLNSSGPSPVRRSLSTDRGASIRSRVKADTMESKPISKVPFPARVLVNKSIVTMPTMPPADNNSRIQDNDNILEAFYQKLGSTKVQQEHEEEQFRQALNVRQGGIRKIKPEIKAKAKQQAPSMLLSDTDASEKMKEQRKSDFSKP